MLADALPPLRPDGADAEGVLPQVDTIRARVGFSRTDLPLDGAFLDGFAVDTSKDFYPFGEQPARFAAFYIACKDAFSRRGARIELGFAFVQTGIGDAGSPLVRPSTSTAAAGRRSVPSEEYADDDAVASRNDRRRTPRMPTAKVSLRRACRLGRRASVERRARTSGCACASLSGDYGQAAVARGEDRSERHQQVHRDARGRRR